MPAPFNAGLEAANADVLVGPTAVTNASSPAMVRRGASENFNFLNIRPPPRAFESRLSDWPQIATAPIFQITHVEENDNRRIFLVGCDRVK